MFHYKWMKWNSKLLPGQKSHSPLRRVGDRLAINNIISPVIKAVKPVIIYTILILLLSGCYTFHYYTLSTKEIEFRDDTIEFGISSADWIIELRDNPNNYEKPGDPLYNLFERYRQLEVDSTKRYYTFGIYYRCKSYKADWVNMKADSIVIRLSKTGDTLDFKGFEQVVERVETKQPAFSIYIEPIAIPKSYDGDIEIEFILSIYDSDFVRLLGRMPIDLTGTYHKETNTYLFPGYP